MKKLLTIPSIAIIFALTGCGGSDSTDTIESSNPSTAVAQAIIAPGSVCPNGGVEISVGIDENANGVLDNNEVDAVEVICNGIDGIVGTDGPDGIDGSSSLIRMTDEAPGANCTEGGIKVEAGLDDDGNGSLEDIEVDVVNYVCNANIPTQVIVAGYSIDHTGCYLFDNSEASVEYVFNPTQVRHSFWNCASIDKHFNVSVEMLFTDLGQGCYEYFYTDISQGNCNEPAIAPANPSFALNVLNISAVAGVSETGQAVIIFDEVIQNIGNVSAIGIHTNFIAGGRGVGTNIKKIPAGDTYDSKTMSTQKKEYHIDPFGSEAGVTYNFDYSIYPPFPIAEIVANDALELTVPALGSRNLVISSFTPSAYIDPTHGTLCIELGPIGVTNLQNEYVYGVELAWYKEGVPDSGGTIALLPNEQREFSFLSGICTSGHTYSVGDQITISAKVREYTDSQIIYADNSVLLTIQ